MMLFVKPHLFAFCVCFLCQYECVYTVGRPTKACDQAQISVGDRPEDVVLMCPCCQRWIVSLGTVRALSLKRARQLIFPSTTSAGMIRPLEKQAPCVPHNEVLRDSVAFKLS